MPLKTLIELLSCVAFSNTQVVQQKVSKSKSSVKISDQVARKNPKLIEAVFWSSLLDNVFKENLKNDPELRWQNFGSIEGFLRTYPTREWSLNFAGFQIDYDPRLRPWYIGATSGPKDIVIILDCSLSMEGNKFHMAKQVAKTVLNTLTKQDYVNVICGHDGHYDEVGKWVEYKTEVLSCQQNRLVPASTSHRKDLIEKIDNLKAGGTTDLKKAFKLSFELLQGNARTGCQSIIVFATDGEDNDGDPVRCGKGYYTRSGYVPGQICQYDWNDVWDEVQARNRYMSPRTRIFSYLTADNGEEFPGKLSCDNQGYMKKLTDEENIISQMQDYYSFLASNTISVSNVTWTSPYLDASGLGLMVTVAMPVISKVTNKTIGVVGIDATLEEIENILLNDQWGSVYAFLVNERGETIFHPLLRPSTELVDDPIFIPISTLEQRNGKPTEFNTVAKSMMDGETGSLRIEDAIRSIPKGDFQDGVMLVTLPSTYYYTSIKDSEYVFAFNLADSDKNYRRPASPPRGMKIPVNYYANIESYNSSEVKQVLGDLYTDLDVQHNLAFFPDVPVTFNSSTVMLSPKTYCHPNTFLFRENNSDIAIEAHRFLNGIGDNIGCPQGRFRASVRPDVEITSLIEEIWKNNRSSEILKDVPWTYIGTRSGIFRSYPGHRSRKNFDPTKRPWYHRALVNPSKAAVSNAYMDANGIGKVITISEAVFQAPPQNTSNMSCGSMDNLQGGCPCARDVQCISGKCRVYTGNRSLCAGDRVEAVTALDILYNDFHRRMYGLLNSSGEAKSCGMNYTCPDGEHLCQTRCYLMDNLANLVTDPDFLLVSTTDAREYERVSLGRKEGDIMKLLVTKHKFFVPNQRVDFQGICSVSPYAPKVTLEGIVRTPEQEDDYYKNRGPIPPFRNEYGCIQDVVGYTSDDSVLGPDGIIADSVDGPCRSGNFFLSALPRTNLYLLVIENWSEYRQSYFYNFNCHISNRVFDAGAFRIVNGTCAHIETEASLKKKEKCPALKNVHMQCSYNVSNALTLPSLLQHLIATLIVILNWR
ncbi:hypothetical protein OS493_015788 [Desmophyllum pertusum]|uniref:VWFA domain-containing protein n=1 Tax=Desmophyllum pertusum TaxID=174260 RepID=A0A9W9YCR8_9CNID|nr:hypothetical protein OS493_015788 [Desmophyllum pertusum]